jgi:3-hydroxyisobutyrate dehydrogenase-like beta-hydroxyacid dehydrogenase
MGTTMKLVVNTLLGLGMQALAEAIALGKNVGTSSMCFLPGAFLLIRGSAFGATAHDAAHCAFMTLPPYT